MEAVKMEPWRAEEERRRMEFNQKAGERFDDWWMFGDCHAVARLKTMFRWTTYDGKPRMYEWCDYANAHHFDYRGLIPKGLAIESPEGMYKTK